MCLLVARVLELLEMSTNEFRDFGVGEVALRDAVADLWISGSEGAAARS